MKKEDIKTGMTAIDMRNMEWMFFRNEKGDLTRIPITNVFTGDNQGQIIGSFKALHPETSFNTNSMGEDLIETDFAQYGNDKYSPYQITKIFYAKLPTEIFNFNENDLIWSLEVKINESLK